MAKTVDHSIKTSAKTGRYVVKKSGKPSTKPMRGSTVGKTSDGVAILQQSGTGSRSFDQRKIATAIREARRRAASDHRETMAAN